MSISQTDIKLMASERLTDYDDGGGEMTGSEIVDGQLNNLFPDISRLDRTYGRVSLRKAFAAVMTENTDMYYGSHAIITDPPDDDNVHVTLFSTEDNYDERLDAQDHIESYVTIAALTALRPMNDQLKGQRAINCFASTSAELPEIGDTLVLWNSNTDEQQYVKVTGLSASNQTFVDANNNSFTLQVVILDLSAALQYTFPGLEVTRLATLAATRIHSTVVADASNYYGVSALKAAASSGDKHFTVGSIYNQLVPTSDIETALVDQLMGADNVSILAKGGIGSLTWTGTRTEAANVIHLPDGIVPGSLNITIAGYTFTDQLGALVAEGSDGGYSGTVTYSNGQIMLSGPASFSADISLTATPGMAVSEQFSTMEIVIELENRAYNYTPNLADPLPAPGSVSVSYMAQGRWYKLYDDGAGVLVPEKENTGTGTVDYSSGSVIFTCGALPDVGSSIIFSWGHGTDVHDESGSIDGIDAAIRKTLSNGPVNPGSVVISWDDNGTDRSLTDDGAGNLSGDGAGTVYYASSGTAKPYVKFTPAPFAATGTEYTIDYDNADSETEKTAIPAYSMAGATLTISDTLSPAPIVPGSLKIEVKRRRIKYYYTDTGITVRSVGYDTYWDNGSGVLTNSRGEGCGTINNTTGVISLTRNMAYDYRTYNPIGAVNDAAPEIISVSATFIEDTTPTWSSASDSVSAADIVIDLAPDTVLDVLPGSVSFSLGGHQFYDDGAGSMYYDKDSTSGVGTLAGTVNYATATATLTNWPVLATTDITLDSLYTRDGGFSIREIVFRTPGTPLRDGSLSVRANTRTSTTYNLTTGHEESNIATTYSAVAETDGSISGTGITGTVDTINGVVRLAFDYPVIPETALYNCVVYTRLPLDADIIGIEPIRLPSDGRVPIFKSGDVAVVHHTEDELLPSGLVADQVVTLSRGDLALCTLTDQNGTTIPETLYTMDLTAGTITLSNPLDLSTYSQPLVAAHRIEDMVLISEAQINGYISTVGPLTHDYPAADTQVSSCLIFGDLAGRIVRSFTQKTWDSVWRDAISGDDTTAKYDDKNYPFTLTNKGCIAQRWCLKFTGSTEFDVVGEKLGVVASGTINSNCAPNNPATGVPYFSIDYRGWGTGWATGNCLRFDTSAANSPLWIARTTMQGAVQEPTDEFVLQIRGDAN